MKIVKLNAINSTNTFLKDLVKNSNVENWTIVVTEDQTAGKGQLQNKWHAASGKNLTFSVLCELMNFKVQYAFYLNCIVSLAIFNVLQRYIPIKLKIKWPNDILSHAKKICGILIENTVSNDHIIRSIIGIGLNVNQIDFEGLPNATSLKLISNKEFDRDELLEELANEIKKLALLIENHSFEKIKTTYESHLFRMNIPAMYQNTQEHQFMGKILGIDTQGRLIVESENESVNSYDLKEIRFI